MNRGCNQHQTSCMRGSQRDKLRDRETETETETHTRQTHTTDTHHSRPASDRQTNIRTIHQIIFGHWWRLVKRRHRNLSRIWRVGLMRSYTFDIVLSLKNVMRRYTVDMQKHQRILNIKHCCEQIVFIICTRELFMWFDRMSSDVISFTWLIIVCKNTTDVSTQTPSMLINQCVVVTLTRYPIAHGAPIFNNHILELHSTFVPCVLVGLAHSGYKHLPQRNK